ncbi:MAG TPA: hypothetical protein VI259_07510 [Gemmatimonadaceae bacterium]
MIEMDRPRHSAGFYVRLVGAWALVGVPLGWGVWQVIQRSLDLFH